MIALPNSSAFDRLQPLIGERTRPRAPHQRVEIPLHHLVERRGAAGDEAGAQQQSADAQRARAARPAAIA